MSMFGMFVIALLGSYFGTAVAHLIWAKEEQENKRCSMKILNKW